MIGILLCNWWLMDPGGNLCHTITRAGTDVRNGVFPAIKMDLVNADCFFGMKFAQILSF